MKIIKHKAEPKQEELNELFGIKKKVVEPASEPAAPPVKAQVNRDWDRHYNTLEAIRKTGLTKFSAGLCFVNDSGVPVELAQEVVQSWIDNYDELAFKLHWNTEA